LFGRDNSLKSPIWAEKGMFGDHIATF